jgi:hypothetical protein
MTVVTVTVDDLKRDRLERAARYYRAWQESLVAEHRFELAADVRGFARNVEAELRRMDGCCGECGRPHART